MAGQRPTSGDQSAGAAQAGCGLARLGRSRDTSRAEDLRARVHEMHLGLARAPRQLQLLGGVRLGLERVPGEAQQQRHAPPL